MSQSRIRRGGIRRCETERANHWRPIITEWAASGLTQAEFCRQKGIKAYNFNWWKRRLSDRPSSSGDKRSSARRRHSGGNTGYSANSFVEVKMADGAPFTGYEVVLSGSRVLRLPRGFDTEAVTRLVAAVEAAC